MGAGVYYGIATLAVLCLVFKVVRHALTSVEARGLFAVAAWYWMANQVYVPNVIQPDGTIFTTSIYCVLCTALVWIHPKAWLPWALLAMGFSTLYWTGWYAIILGHDDAYVFRAVKNLFFAGGLIAVFASVLHIGVKRLGK